MDDSDDTTHEKRWSPRVPLAPHERLLPAAERAELVRCFGQSIEPVLARMLDAKVEKLANSYRNLNAVFEKMQRDEERACSGPAIMGGKSAAAYLSISLSTLKRLVQQGRLPEPVQLSEHRVGYRVADLDAYIAANGRGHGVKRTDK